MRGPCTIVPIISDACFSLTPVYSGYTRKFCCSFYISCHPIVPASRASRSRSRRLDDPGQASGLLLGGLSKAQEKLSERTSAGVPGDQRAAERWKTGSSSAGFHSLHRETRKWAVIMSKASGRSDAASDTYMRTHRPMGFQGDENTLPEIQLFLQPHLFVPY